MQSEILDEGEKSPFLDRKFQVGIIGTGYIANLHLEVLRKIKEVKVLACCDVDIRKAEEFGKRWKAAKMLNKNIPYSKIEKETGLSSTTVARVAKWLKKGMGGYRLMLRKLNLHHHNSSSTFGKGLC